MGTSAETQGGVHRLTVGSCNTTALGERAGSGPFWPGYHLNMKFSFRSKVATQLKGSPFHRCNGAHKSAAAERSLLAGHQVQTLHCSEGLGTLTALKISK